MTAISTVVVTPFGNTLTASDDHAITSAQFIADATGSPCGVWMRDGWYTVCDVAPEMIEPDPELAGWRLWAVTDPWAVVDHTAGE